jgi:hypothetical protein
MKKGNLYWHFLPNDGRLQFGNRELVKIRHTLALPPDTVIIPCSVGFHASKRAIDALKYAPGPVVCQVTLHGRIVPHGNPIDKYAAHGRTVLKMADASNVLMAFARWCALQVIHLWDAPEVVKDWLETGDEKTRTAAESAAWSAAGSAAESAARSAAWSAAKSAAESAAWSAAESAAWSAAGSAAWSAAWSAAESVAWSAAESATWSAAWSAAESAAWSAQNEKLESMLNELLK